MAEPKTQASTANSKISPQSFDYLVILDFEATCDDKVKLNPQEIIEFPSVLLNLKTGEIEDEFQQYVKPKHHPKLTEFCTGLTGIQQAWVDKGIELEPTLSAYEKWLVSKGLVGGDKTFSFVTCGDWDLKTMLPSQSRAYGIKPAGYFSNWINIKFAFNDCYKRRANGMTDMLSHLHLRLEGRHHSGIDDCRNITAVAKRMLQDGFVFKHTWAGAAAKNPAKANPTPNWITLGKGKICLSQQPSIKYLSEWKTEQGLSNVLMVMTTADGAANYQKTYNGLSIPWSKLAISRDDIPLPSRNNDFAKDIEAAVRGVANGAGLLIHCDSGTKRTAMVAFAVLRCLGKTRDEALALMKQSREATVQYLDANREAWGEQMCKHLNIKL